MDINNIDNILNIIKDNRIKNILQRLIESEKNNGFAYLNKYELEYIVQFSQYIDIFEKYILWPEEYQKIQQKYRHSLNKEEKEKYKKFINDYFLLNVSYIILHFGDKKVINKFKDKIDWENNSHTLATRGINYLLSFKDYFNWKECSWAISATCPQYILELRQYLNFSSLTFWRELNLEKIERLPQEKRRGLCLFLLGLAKLLDINLPVLKKLTNFI